MAWQPVLNVSTDGGRHWRLKILLDPTPEKRYQVWQESMRRAGVDHQLVQYYVQRLLHIFTDIYTHKRHSSQLVPWRVEAALA